ncbi:hypothetical protein M441DRAFT_150835 [Trichoderma asperellum CBS 433.97]|uniref:tRNA wybutosine-synthesizing protein 4 n=1 Tax=Trichoderma asperellum (strain ATCC 204424 / CBS 433.97 / NBRC 101777) TaxID=1042311 RepID=A0A2T3YUN5_TRIA4|nr:hypothetical protein M441DRAFT_150835 [Trichoderma asperellum CBS 433.97]PTB36290.1 hypothetical protein M441DRAFT_150835 [Trichoderma asperellum CBS 433.97]
MAKTEGCLGSPALDDMVMGTNNSSIASKRSVERLYYGNEPSFFRYFVPKFQRRAPLINRGYWLRLRAIDVIVQKFLSKATTGKKVVINLGCGSDVLPWQCHARYKDLGNDVLFIDIDYPDLIRKKRAIVLQTPELRDLLGNDFTLGCDLRQLDQLRDVLKTVIDLPECAILFVAEVSITYMDTQSADSLIHWGSTVGRENDFCLLEQILPFGKSHPFAQQMLSHFEKLSTPLRSIEVYPTVESQIGRFQERGWSFVEIKDLWQTWSSEQFVTDSERIALDNVEPFDEWEEFILFARHYFVLHASTSPNQRSSLKGPSSIWSMGQKKPAGLRVEMIGRSSPKTTRRRFGNIMISSNAFGQRFALNLLGMSLNSREPTYDIFSLDGEQQPPQLPSSGPPARMCFTLTDLGDYGIMHSAVRLGNSSLLLIFGGKKSSSKLSDEIFLFSPDKACWQTCKVVGSAPDPCFGSVAFNGISPSDQPGTFRGMLAGGMSQNGCINTKQYTWQINAFDAQPTISFSALSCNDSDGRLVSSFGAQVVDLGASVIICGGMGAEPSLHGQTITAIRPSVGGFDVTSFSTSNDDKHMPFMIGSSIIPCDDSLLVMGGGATCFSMGTFWETGIYKVHMPDHILDSLYRTSRPSASSKSAPGLLGSRKFSTTSATTPSEDVRSLHRGEHGIQITPVPRIQLESAEQFQKILRDGKPVIFKSCNIGHCQSKWSPEFLVSQIGANEKFVIHESREDKGMMDFNSKNFAYVTDSFGSIMNKLQSGARVYLRALSRNKPSEMPANLEEDFPRLAEDFTLPPEMAYIKDRLFSSVLRLSGRVNMWLHYDVMANVYAQVTGVRKMILFPPSDVKYLSFAPGASSSSIDVFQGLEASAASLHGTHPQEAVIHPGDVLLLPALWLHTAAPMSDMSTAVNVFFRDLEQQEHYASGRDVYGNKDLEAYEKGRQAVARIAKTLRPLPPAAKEFYLSRIVDELRLALEE